MRSIVESFEFDHRGNRKAVSIVVLRLGILQRINIERDSSRSHAGCGSLMYTTYGL